MCKETRNFVWLFRDWYEKCWFPWQFPTAFNFKNTRSDFEYPHYGECIDEFLNGTATNSVLSPWKIHWNMLGQTVNGQGKFTFVLWSKSARRWAGRYFLFFVTWMECSDEGQGREEWKGRKVWVIKIRLTRQFFSFSRLPVLSNASRLFHVGHWSHIITACMHVFVHSCIYSRLQVEKRVEAGVSRQTNTDTFPSYRLVFISK